MSQHGGGEPQILKVTRAEWGPEDVPGKQFLFGVKNFDTIQGTGSGEREPGQASPWKPQPAS